MQSGFFNLSENRYSFFHILEAKREMQAEHFTEADLTAFLKQTWAMHTMTESLIAI